MLPNTIVGHLITLCEDAKEKKMGMKDEKKEKGDTGMVGIKGQIN